MNNIIITTRKFLVWRLEQTKIMIYKVKEKEEIVFYHS